MKKFTDLLLFEINRIKKAYLMLIGLIVSLQIVANIWASNNFMRIYKNYLKETRGSMNDFLENWGKFDFFQVQNHFIFELSIMLGIFALVLYVFVIWYRDWIGKNNVSYRFLTLPGSRMSIFYAKLACILFLTDAHYQELVERAHFMGVSRTAIILLHLYLYEGIFSDLSLEELQLDLNPCEVAQNSIQVLVPDPLVSKYQHHKTYFLSGSAYFTGFLNVVIEKTTGLWHTSPTLQERTPTTLSLDQRIIDQVEDFSKETGLQFSVIAAYYVTYAPLPLGTPRSYEATDKVQFGLRLTDRAHYQLKERAIRKKMKPNQVLSLGFQDFMDKKILPGGY